MRHIAGEGQVVETTWAGRDDDGRSLPDGVYALRADATSADGQARSATEDLRLDTVPPRIESAAIAPDPFSPNGDGQDDVATLAFVPGESGTARVSVIAADGAALRRLTGWKAVSASAQKARWDGRISSASGLKPAAEGAAILLLELRDARGQPDERAAHGDRGPDAGARQAVSRKTLSPNGDGVHDAVTLSFRLTRAADVTATVVHSGSTVRTMRLGRLASGARSVEWDGKLGGGGTATSGAYSLRLTADGALGVTTAAQPLTVDLARPRVTASATASVRYGKTARLSYTVRDAFSPTVKVSATVTDAKGRTIATLALRMGQAGREPHLRVEAEGAPDVHGDVQGDGPRRQPPGRSGGHFTARPLTSAGRGAGPGDADCRDGTGGSRPTVAPGHAYAPVPPLPGTGASGRAATCVRVRRRGARTAAERAAYARSGRRPR